MQKKLLVLIIIFLMTVIFFSGCNSSDDIEKNKFIGYWTGEDITTNMINGTTYPLGTIILIFYTNNTFFCKINWYHVTPPTNTYTGPWDISNGKISFKDYSSTAYIIEDARYIFSDNDQLLKIDTGYFYYQLKKV
jgi:hypothetical protein